MDCSLPVSSPITIGAGSTIRLSVCFLYVSRQRPSRPQAERSRPAGRAVSDGERDTNSNWCSLPLAVYSIRLCDTLETRCSIINNQSFSCSCSVQETMISGTGDGVEVYWSIFCIETLHRPLVKISNCMQGWLRILLISSIDVEYKYKYSMSTISRYILNKELCWMQVNCITNSNSFYNKQSGLGHDTVVSWYGSWNLVKISLSNSCSRSVLRPVVDLSKFSK